MTTLASVEELALQLPESQRATLALRILESLPALFVEPDEGEAEAARRNAELDADPGSALTFQEFDRMVQARSPR